MLEEKISKELKKEEKNYYLRCIQKIMEINIVKAFGFAVSVHDTYLEILIGFILFKVNV